MVKDKQIYSEISLISLEVKIHAAIIYLLPSLEIWMYYDFGTKYVNPRISTAEFESYQVQTPDCVDYEFFVVLRKILYGNNSYILKNTFPCRCILHTLVEWACSVLFTWEVFIFLQFNVNSFLVWLLLISVLLFRLEWGFKCSPKILRARVSILQSQKNCLYITDKTYAAAYSFSANSFSYRISEYTDMFPTSNIKAQC